MNIHQHRSPVLGRAARTAGIHSDPRYRLPTAHLAGGANSGSTRQGGRLDHHRRRKTGRQQADRPAVHRFRRQPAAAVLPEPAIGGGQPDMTHCSTGGSNLGPESVVDTPADPAKLAAAPVRRRRLQAEPVDAGVFAQRGGGASWKGGTGSRPFCTGGGVGAVLSVIGPRDSRGDVVHPTRVVSVNEPCADDKQPFVDFYEGVRVECAKFGEDYSIRPDRADSRGRSRRSAGSGRCGDGQRQRPGPEYLAGLRRHPGRPGGQGPACQRRIRYANVLRSTEPAARWASSENRCVNVRATQPATRPQVPGHRLGPRRDDG